MNDVRRMGELEGRIAYLESRIIQIERQMDSAREERSVANEMIIRYGQCVNKTEAANLLKVTRTTVYNYIAEGLLETTAHGMVTTQSIARCLKGRKGQKKGDRHEEADG